MLWSWFQQMKTGSYWKNSIEFLPIHIIQTMKRQVMLIWCSMWTNWKSCGEYNNGFVLKLFLISPTGRSVKQMILPHGLIKSIPMMTRINRFDLSYKVTSSMVTLYIKRIEVITITDNITQIKYIKVIDKLYRVTDISFTDMSIHAVETTSATSVLRSSVFNLEELREFRIRLVNNGGAADIIEFRAWKCQKWANEITVSSKEKSALCKGVNYWKGVNLGSRISEDKLYWWCGVSGRMRLKVMI